MTKINIERSKLASDYGYLLGQSKDLTTQLKDSIRNGYIEYFYYNKKDTSELYKYYSTIGLDHKIKVEVDNLNLINKSLSAVHFKNRALTSTTEILEQNFILKHLAFGILALMSAISFFGCLFLWYKKRHMIDK